MVYVFIDTNGNPFLFRRKKKAIQYMKEKYFNEVKYIDTINGHENWFWTGNEEYMTITKCEVKDEN